ALGAVGGRGARHRCPDRRGARARARRDRPAEPPARGWQAHPNPHPRSHAVTEPNHPVVARTIATARLEVHARFAGAGDGWPVVFLHGNCSDSRFWIATMAALPAGLRGVAPDLRGFGATAPAPIDATRGMRDF